LSNLFCHWAKDTLAAGLDPVAGVFPDNVHVFDFFHALADTDGFLPDMYRTESGNSHPNAAATALVAPQLVSELFDAAIAYEAIYNGVAGASDAPGPDGGPPLVRISPNPFTSLAAICYQLPAPGKVTLRVYNCAGQLVRILIEREQTAGSHRAQWDGRDAAGRPAAAGAYVCRLRAAGRSSAARIVLVR
jgi:hypothetical protein